jgi:hypothetical protein
MSNFEKQAVDAIKQSNSDYFKSAVFPENQGRAILDVPLPSTYSKYQAKLDELKNNNVYA